MAEVIQPERSGESTTDYSKMLEEAKSEVRPGEEGYVQNEDKARFMAEGQDSLENSARKAEDEAQRYEQIADERFAEGKVAHSGDLRRLAELRRRSAQDTRAKIDEVVDRKGELYDYVEDKKKAA
jgi:hypothetical protein